MKAKGVAYDNDLFHQFGQELALTLLNISRAWETANLWTSSALVNSLTSNNKLVKNKAKTFAYKLVH